MLHSPTSPFTHHQRDKRLQLTWLCEDQLFRQEMEDADDIRLSVRLFSKCLADKKKFCGEALPGNSQVRVNDAGVINRFPSHFLLSSMVE